jgi:uncharacterized protein (DUF849 family)
VRDAAGNHSLDAGAYREAIAAIKTHCGDDLVVQTTTESAGRFTPAQQMASVRALMPRAISLAPREILEGDRRSAFAFLAWAEEAGVAIQYILYDDSDLDRLGLLRARGAIAREANPRIILVIGRYGDGTDSSVAEYRARFAALAKAGLDRGSVWSICAFGRGEIACLQAAIADGGHARVGFENSVVDHTGALVADNAERVALVAELARGLGREVTTGAAAAAILGLRHG